MGPLAIEVQLRGEAASALRHVGSKLDSALAELVAMHAQLLQTEPGPARVTRVAEYRAKRAEVEHRKWMLIVQREAMGLSHHGEVDEVYPLPPPVRE